MKQEELRKKIRKLEKVESKIFNICSLGIDIKHCYMTYCVDEESADIELEKLRTFLDNPKTLINMQLGNKTVYYNEQFTVYHKFGKIFMDLAKIQKKKFCNKLEAGKGEGEIFCIANIMKSILEETMDIAYDWLQKFGVTDFSRKEIQFQYAQKLKVDHEILIAPFFKEIERRVLMCFKENEDAVMLDCGNGRMRLYDPMVESMVGDIYDTGALKNNVDYMKLLDDELQRESLKEKYANFIFDQTIEIGKYVVELLVQKQKMPVISHDFDVQLIYEAYLQKFLSGKITDDDFSDVLWTILGESLDNEMILSGILDFETIHDRAKRTELYQWSEENGYHIRDTSRNNVFFYSRMEEDEFIDYYDTALYLAKNEIEAHYYMRRYRGWYLNVEEGEKEEINSLEKQKYVCDWYHTQVGVQINKLREVESRVSKDYKKIEDVVSCVNNYIKAHKWSEAVALVDGKCGYVEWALFRAIEEQIKYNYEIRFGDKITYIGSLLSNAKSILSEVDKSIEETLTGVQGDALKTIALNVFRAACHYSYIQMEHFVLNMPDRQVESVNIVEYKRWRTEYKEKREKINFQMMKQCEMVIVQGVNRGVALSCILLLESKVPSNLNEQQKLMMYQVASQKYCPEQMIKKGESYLTDTAKASEALEAYYWYSLAQQLVEKSTSINDVIKQIHLIICREM